MCPARYQWRRDSTSGGSHLGATPRPPRAPDCNPSATQRPGPRLPSLGSPGETGPRIFLQVAVVLVAPCDWPGVPIHARPPAIPSEIAPLPVRQARRLQPVCDPECSVAPANGSRRLDVRPQQGGCGRDTGARIIWALEGPSRAAGRVPLKACTSLRQSPAPTASLPQVTGLVHRSLRSIRRSSIRCHPYRALLLQRRDLRRWRQSAALTSAGGRFRGRGSGNPKTGTPDRDSGPAGQMETR
jgi:hypothetical protein